MRILLVGCGGYAAGYARALLAMGGRGLALEGIADPYAAGSPAYPEIAAAGVPVYDTPEAFYREHDAALAIIATPIFLHHEQALACLRHGSHVLLEKPMAATVRQAQDIAAAARDAGRKLGIGFQLCYDEVMLRLKQAVDRGDLGAPVRLRGLILWPRPRAYYARGGGWAGRRALPDGRPVNDSILTNATAHYLMNMLWLTTPGMASRPAAACEAQLARAYPIETFDTLAARFALACGAEALLYLSHALDTRRAPRLLLEYAFERATVRVTQRPGYGFALTSRDAAGRERDWGRLTASYDSKIEAMVRAIEDGAPLTCPAEAGLASMVSNALVFANDLNDVETLRPLAEDETGVWAPGLADTLRAAFAARRLPREMGLPLGG